VTGSHCVYSDGKRLAAEKPSTFHLSESTSRNCRDDKGAMRQSLAVLQKGGWIQGGLNDSSMSTDDTTVVTTRINTALKAKLEALERF
jgi:hypothetical protein